MRNLVRRLITPLANWVGGGWDSQFFVERDGATIWLGYTDQFGGTHLTDITPATARHLGRRLRELAHAAETFTPE